MFDNFGNSVHTLLHKSGHDVSPNSLYTKVCVEMLVFELTKNKNDKFGGGKTNAWCIISLHYFKWNDFVISTLWNVGYQLEGYNYISTKLVGNI